MFQGQCVLGQGGIDRFFFFFFFFFFFIFFFFFKKYRCWLADNLAF